MWVFKTYKIKHEGAEPLLTNAVKRRIDKLDRPLDLTRHEDRQLIGYNYLEYVKCASTKTLSKRKKKTK